MTVKKRCASRHFWPREVFSAHKLLEKSTWRNVCGVISRIRLARGVRAPCHVAAGVRFFDDDRRDMGPNPLTSVRTARSPLVWDKTIKSHVSTPTSHAIQIGHCSRPSHPRQRGGMPQCYHLRQTVHTARKGLPSQNGQWYMPTDQGMGAECMVHAPSEGGRWRRDAVPRHHAMLAIPEGGQGPYAPSEGVRIDSGKSLTRG